MSAFDKLTRLISTSPVPRGKEGRRRNFHTLNALYGSQKRSSHFGQITRAIAGLEQRLRSRFEGGLIADIHPPTREMRLNILHTKAAGLGVTLPPEVADVLVDRTGSNVRELEGALNRVVAQATTCGAPITVALAESAVGPLRRQRPEISVEAVQEAVSSGFGVSIFRARVAQSGAPARAARQIAMYLSRKIAEASFPCIGEKFGGRDHSTVIVRRPDDGSPGARFDQEVDRFSCASRGRSGEAAR